jgi:glucosamine-6-phosphate deaminase
MEVIIKENYDQMCDETVHLIYKNWQEKNDLVLGLATGRSPLGVYARLISLYEQKQMDFSYVRTFNLDEYIGLPEDHPQSFAFYMEKNFFRSINIRKENIHQLSGTPQDIKGHCRAYEDKIKEAGGIDIQILGIGRNGHIGFNEPGSSLSSRTRAKTLTRSTIEANARFFKNKEEVPRYCLTMGIGTILDARMVILLASGKEKAEAIAKTVEGPVTASVPGSALQLHRRAKIIIDYEAASLLQRKDYYLWVYENRDKFTEALKK